MKNGKDINILANIGVIITAGGKSERFGSNKLLEKIEGKEIILISISKFLPYADEIVVPCNTQIKDLIKKHFNNPKIQFAPPGANRQKSVFNALNVLKPCDYVLIHDGARPYVDDEIISRTIKEVKEKLAVVVGVRAIDTIKICDEKGKILSTPNRQNIYYAQTPQAFAYKKILHAHKELQNHPAPFSDDGGMLEYLGEEVYITEGSYKNKKITTKEDLS
jgi:2-C-methyl-D-erythritol 4-phosphate cytidylyltransferase